MGIIIAGYSFEGPFTSTDNLEDRAGVYAILCDKDDKYYVIDAGESARVKTRVDNHDRKDCWKRNCTGTLKVAVYYTPNMQQQGRMQVEQEIRDKYDPPCGKI